MFNKVVIWGHKLHTHTHSYIHSSYFKAFSALGYETYWLGVEDLNYIDNFDFNNCLFFTENQAKIGMPLNESSYYIVHHIDNSYFFQNNVYNVLNLGNYILESEKYEKINEYTWYDNKTKTLYQPWATDLLPEEIDLVEPNLYDSQKEKINYIGSLYGELESIVMPFINEINRNNKQFEHFIHKSDSINMKLVRDSYLSVDFRNNHHLNVGYLPCRVFKNISYGKPTGTNSLNVKKILGDNVIYSSNTRDLYYSLEKEYENCTYEKIKDSMNLIKTKHTFINRINELLKVI